MSMTNMTTSSICSTPTLHPLRNSIFNVAFCCTIPRRQSRYCVAFCTIQQETSIRLSYVRQLTGRDHKDMLKPVCAIGSGLEASMAEAEGSILTFKTIDIAVESQDAEKIKLKVDLSGEETQKAYNVVLSKLASSAPAIPGFRRQKGGKTSKIPRNLLLDIIGRERVTKFVIREVVTSAVAGYMEKEKLTVRDNKINTTQTEDELKQSFLPGNPFGFSVEVELGTEETELGMEETELGTEETELDTEETELDTEETETAASEAET